jgi:Na+/proline symporter
VSALDWAVLGGTTLFIVLYGVWHSRSATADEFVRGDQLRWPTIGLGVMATQASAVTFLSTPGQAYDDGMRFVQFYFGLPLAMIVISAIFVPAYYRLKVVTAYEYLEHRFDARVRYLGAVLFLIGRGLATGITIYAPAIVFSSILGWPLGPTIVAMGVIVTLYTIAGGSKTVNITQKHQMIVMLTGVLAAAVIVILKLPKDVGVGDALRLAGALGRTNVVSFELDPTSRYNFWSGVGGGFFLAMSYFGTDQSQVGRYLSGRSVTESRLGLLFNGMFKVPMQFVILFTGLMVFVFYLFVRPPVFFNSEALARIAHGPHAAELTALEHRFDDAFDAERRAALAYVRAPHGDPAELRAAAAAVEAVRADTRTLVSRALPRTERRDTDYVFLSFVLANVPRGLLGLLMAVILCAAMASVASELIALGNCSVQDLWKRLRRSRSEPDPRRDVRLSKLFIVVWGALAIGFASFAAMLDNLIQAVNIIGSLFYGTLLGMFCSGFFQKRVTATPVLIASLISQAVVVTLYFASSLGFLWYNVIGTMVVVILAPLLERMRGSPA